MIGRIVIDDPRPRTPGGHPGKGVIGEPLRISADIFRDGHDILAAKVQWRPVGDAKWRDVPMELVAVQDRFGRSGKQDELMAAFGLKAPDVVRAAERALARKRPR